MSKKKRNKSYKGSGAAVTRPKITRVQAVNRSRPHQWWVDNKRIAKPALIATGIGGLVVVVIIGIVGIFVG